MNIHGSIHTRSRLYLYVYVYSRGRSMRICICMFVINTMRFTITLSSFFFLLYLRPLETKSLKRVTSTLTTTRTDSCTLIATPSEIQKRIHVFPRLTESSAAKHGEQTLIKSAVRISLAFESDGKIDRTLAKVVRHFSRSLQLFSRFVKLRDKA